MHARRMSLTRSATEQASAGAVARTCTARPASSTAAPGSMASLPLPLWSACMTAWHARQQVGLACHMWRSPAWFTCVTQFSGSLVLFVLFPQTPHTLSHLLLSGRGGCAVLQLLQPQGVERRCGACVRHTCEEGRSCSTWVGRAWVCAWGGVTHHATPSRPHSALTHMDGARLHEQVPSIHHLQRVPAAPGAGHTFGVTWVGGSHMRCRAHPVHDPCLVKQGACPHPPLSSRGGSLTLP